MFFFVHIIIKNVNLDKRHITDQKTTTNVTTSTTSCNLDQWHTVAAALSYKRTERPLVPHLSCQHC